MTSSTHIHKAHSNTNFPPPPPKKKIKKQKQKTKLTKESLDTTEHWESTPTYNVSI
jgi:hypothetical protein